MADDLDIDDFVCLPREPAGTPSTAVPPAPSSLQLVRDSGAAHLARGTQQEVPKHTHTLHRPHSKHAEQAPDDLDDDMVIVGRSSTPEAPAGSPSADEQQHEGYARPEYHARWGSANGALEAAWHDVKLPQSALECRQPRYRELIRHGVPDSKRRRVWMAAACTEELLRRRPHAFELAFESTFGTMGVPPEIGVVPLFGAARLPTDAMCLSEEGVHAAKVVLCMLANQHTELVCCPRLPAVVALLLHFMHFSDAFVVAEAMLESSAAWQARAARSSFTGGSGGGYSGDDVDGADDEEEAHTSVPYLETSRPAVEVFNRSFASSVPYVVGSKTARVAQRLGLDVAGQLAPALFDTLLADALPFGLVVRVADLYMNEGGSVLQRVALVLLAQYRQVLDQAVSADDFVQRLLQGAMQQDVRGAPLIEASCRRLLPASRADRIARKHREALAQQPCLVDDEAPVYYRPKLAQRSTVLTRPLYLEALWGLVPRPLAITDPVLVYEAERDGFNLRHLLEASDGVAPCLVLVRTDKGHVAGFYTAVPLSEALVRKRGAAFGDGETFVFTLAPAVHKYCWAERAEHSNTAFIHYDTQGALHVGAGRSGAALSFTEDLQVDSNPCDTFASPSLFPPLADSSGSSTTKVVCVSLEVMTFG